MLPGFNATSPPWRRFPAGICIVMGAETETDEGKRLPSLNQAMSWPTA